MCIKARFPLCLAPSASHFPPGAAAMKMYTLVSLSLLLCTMAAAATTVACCALKRTEGLTDNRVEPVTIVATMGKTVKLPGYLRNSAEPFYKDDKPLYGSEHLYELTRTPVGYQVSVRFLTCTDEGTYRIGNNIFNLTAMAETCGMFYYTANKGSKTRPALIEPLDGVIRISKLYIEPHNSNMWSLKEVWNDTMSREQSPGHCCFIVNKGNKFGGIGDNQYHYYMYQRRGQADDSCSTVQLAASARPTKVVVPGLQELDDVRTHVTLLNVSEDILDFKRLLEEWDKSLNSAWSPGLHMSSVLTPVVIMMATMLLAI